MKWLLEFYHEKQGILARYDIEASLPAEAVLLGWKELLVEHPPTPRTNRPSLVERAERIGGRDISGWVLYRIVKNSRLESPGLARADAA